MFIALQTCTCVFRLHISHTYYLMSFRLVRNCVSLKDFELALYDTEYFVTCHYIK